MSAGAWKVYDGAKAGLGNGLIDLDTHTLKAVLLLDTSNANDLSLAGYADLTDEHANGNGYTTAGVDLTGVSFTQSAGIATLDCDPFGWSALGGPIAGRMVAIYDDTAAGKPLICVCDNGETASAPDGQPFTVTPAVLGLFTLAGATTD